MKSYYVLILCSVLALVALSVCYPHHSTAFETDEFRLTGTINGQSIDEVFNPATGIRIDLNAPIDFNITFELLTSSDVVIDIITVTIRIFGFDVISLPIPLDQTIPGGTVMQFNSTINLGEMLSLGEGISIIGGSYDVGLAVDYTVVDTGEPKTFESTIYFVIDAPIYGSITGLASLGSLGLVGGKTLLSHPKTLGGAITFGASSSTSSYFVGQQMGWMTFDLTSMILVIIGVCVACGVVGYLILRRKRGKGAECLIQGGKTYCKTGGMGLPDATPSVSSVMELNIDQLTEFMLQNNQKKNE